MKLIWVVFAGVVGFFTARRLTSLYMKLKTRKNNKIESERLMQSRNQTMRLSELRTLNDRLDRSKDETNSLEKSVQRLETILSELERLIEDEKIASSESLLTRFSKHLRQLLHEGESPTLKIDENIEYVEGGLALMSAMNQHSWAYEINTDQIAPIDSNRKVKTIVLSTWVFEQLWDVILKNGIETSVDLHFKSDTYNLEITLRYNQRTVETTLELLA